MADPESLIAALRDIDVVVHSGARMSGTPTEVDQANRVGTHNLARLAAEMGVKRLVFISSGMVYRPGVMSFADESFPVGTEDAYGRSKLDSEAIARTHLNTRLTSLRLPSVYITGLCPFLEQLAGAVLHEALPLVGDGSIPMDLVHGDDLADAIVRAAQGHGRGGTFNICGTSKPSYRGLIDVAAEALGVQANWVPAAPPGNDGASDLAPPDRFAPFAVSVGDGRTNVERCASAARSSATARRRNGAKRSSRDPRAYLIPAEPR